MTKKGVVDWSVIVNIVTGNIARSAKRQYLSNLEADFEVFRPARVTCCTDGNEIVNWLQKTATGNGNLQPEIEINEYSSSKKITRVVYYSSSTRVLAAALVMICWAWGSHLVLVLERQLKDPFIKRLVLDEERMWSGHWLGSVLSVSFGALTLMVGWQEGHSG